MIEQVHDRIWSFKITLPENPLKWLNCYVIKGDGYGRNLLIDCGFRRPECFGDLMSGMEELGLDPKDTDVFLTHLHSDHVGNAKELQELGCRLFMGRADYGSITSYNTWPEQKARAVSEGMEPTVLKEVFDHNPAVLYAPGPFKATTLEDGDELSYGGYTLRCVYTPGHTPGHMCLYNAEHKIMFTGDHVLFDITPNIAYWLEANDSLGDYIDSLERMKKYDVELTLTGHRAKGSVDMYARIDEIISHHGERLAETERIIRENPGLNGYQIAGCMTWQIRAKNWDEFPPGQKWFAMGEALTHLNYLTIRRRIYRKYDVERACIIYYAS